MAHACGRQQASGPGKHNHAGKKVGRGSERPLLTVAVLAAKLRLVLTIPAIARRRLYADSTAVVHVRKPRWRRLERDGRALHS